VKGWGYRVMMFNATFNNISAIIVAISFIGGGNRNTRRIPPTCRKSLANFKACCIECTRAAIKLNQLEKKYHALTALYRSGNNTNYRQLTFHQKSWFYGDRDLVKCLITGYLPKSGFHEKWKAVLPFCLNRHSFQF
jgi:hypothetical protein